MYGGRNNTDYTFNLVQLQHGLIALISSIIGIKHCIFIFFVGLKIKCNWFNKAILFGIFKDAPL